MSGLLLRCPVDAAHGRLLDWPTDRHGFFCPHTAHGGNGAFFTTAEAEAPATRPRPEADPAATNAAFRALDPLTSSGSPVPFPEAPSPGAVSPAPPGLHQAGGQPSLAIAREVPDGAGQQLLFTESSA